jgi:hypothetical protein
MSKPNTLLLAAYQIYQLFGRNLFTTSELSIRTGIDQKSANISMNRLWKRGYVRAFNKPAVKCGDITCHINQSLYSLTKTGMSVAAAREIDYDENTGTYLFKISEPYAPDDVFILELGDGEYVG